MAGCEYAFGEETSSGPTGSEDATFIGRIIGYSQTRSHYPPCAFWSCSKDGVRKHLVSLEMGAKCTKRTQVRWGEGREGCEEVGELGGGVGIGVRFAKSTFPDEQVF